MEPMRRMSLIAIVAAVTCALALASCETNFLSGGDEVVDGRYTYRAYDSAGTDIVTGIVFLRTTDSTSLTGTWDLFKIGEPVGIGPQTGHGSLTGSAGEEVTINLNPRVADDNVILTGELKRGRISGKWQWMTLSGVSARGRFVMTR